MSRFPPPPLGYDERMPRHGEATPLVRVGRDAFDREVSLAPEAAMAWAAMHPASAKADVHLLLLSGFRSIARQTDIVRRKLIAGQSLEAILRVSAYPGHSEHHTGRALDLGSPECAHLSVAFEHTRAFAWLCAHAHEFGFSLSYPRDNAHGIAFEPWHWMLRADHRDEANSPATNSRVDKHRT